MPALIVSMGFTTNVSIFPVDDRLLLYMFDKVNDATILNCGRPSQIVSIACQSPLLLTRKSFVATVV